MLRIQIACAMITALCCGSARPIGVYGVRDSAFWSIRMIPHISTPCSVEVVAANNRGRQRTVNAGAFIVRGRSGAGSVMDVILDIAGQIIYYLIGALVGVLYPPRSREWARWQRCGVMFGLTALIALGLAAVLCQLAVLPPLVWLLVVIGITCMLGYVVVGNMCRKFHEGEGTSSEIRHSTRETLDRAPDRRARRL